MLYKKYHRNFIRRFKKGVRCCRPYSPLTEIYEIVKEPYYSTYYQHIELQSNTCISSWTLIYPSGRINLDVKAIEYVV